MSGQGWDAGHPHCLREEPLVFLPIVRPSSWALDLSDSSKFFRLLLIQTQVGVGAQVGVE